MPGLVPVLVPDRLALGMESGRSIFSQCIVCWIMQVHVVVFGLYADFIIISSILYSPLGEDNYIQPLERMEPLNKGHYET